MSSETTTPNIGLQIPGLNQANWQTPVNYDMNLLDLVFGGSVQVPALNVVTLTAQNLASALAPFFVQETPAGAIPGTVYTLSQSPALFIGLFYNGLLLTPEVDYTQVGKVATLNFVTTADGRVYALYLAVA